MHSNNDHDTEKARVFLAPNAEPVDDGRSMLYLLRRDLQDQYGKENDPPLGKIISPLLTTLGIMIGFELLTKYWIGKYTTTTAELRKFINDVGKLSKNESEILAQLRHALAHGYCLRTTDRKGTQYTFRLDENTGGSNVIEERNSEYIINIWELKKLFLKTISDYQNFLEQSPDLKGKFTSANANLGELKILL